MLASDMTSPYLASISNRLTMWGVSARRALLHNGVLDVVGGSIDDGRAHATARHAAGVDHGIDAPLDEVRRQSRAVGPQLLRYRAIESRCSGPRSPVKLYSTSTISSAGRVPRP